MRKIPTHLGADGSVAWVRVYDPDIKEFLQDIQKQMFALDRARAFNLLDIDEYRTLRGALKTYGLVIWRLAEKYSQEYIELGMPSTAEEWEFRLLEKRQQENVA